MRDWHGLCSLPSKRSEVTGLRLSTPSKDEKIMMRREKLSFIGSLMGIVAMGAFLGSAIIGCSSSPDNSRNPYSGASA